MRKEHSGNIGLPPGNDIGYSTSGSVYLSDDEHDTCSQTGEEFSRTFVRTRSSPPPPIQLMRHLDQVTPHGERHEDLDGDFEYDMQREYSVTMDDINHQLRPNSSRKVPNEHHFHQQASSPFLPKGAPASHYTYQTETMKSSFPPKMKLLCSFGGRILPRPTDGKLRYVGGETRIISMRKIHSFAELVQKTNEIFNQPHTIKYQLPGEDLDSLISVSSDEDLHHMIEEHLELAQAEGCHRLRIFLVPLGDSETTHSFESERTPQNNDRQYLVAVNGIQDQSPLKSLSEQALVSKLGNYPEYSFANHHEAPVQYLSVSPRTPARSLYHAPPISPATLEHRDSQKSHLHYYEEYSFTDTVEHVNPHVFDQHAYESSCFMDHTSFYDKNYVPHTMIDSRFQNIHYMGNQEVHRSREAWLPDFTPQRDFIPYTSSFQRPVTEWELHSHSDHVQDPLSEFNVVHGSNSQKTDPVLQHHGEVSRDFLGKQHMPAYSLEFEAQKSPTLALSSTSDERRQHLEMSDESLLFTVKRNDEERYVTLTPGAPNADYVSQAPDISAVSSEEVYHTKKCFPSCSIHHSVKNKDGHKDVNMKLFYEATQSSLAESSNDWHSDTDITESTPVIKDETGHALPDEQVFLNTDCFVQDKQSNRSASSRESSKFYASESNYEDTKEEVKNELFSDAAIAEIEAGVYGLQIIKHADLEELQELGSGTFGTVYHGKWRGTDVAIKRIKKSCFDGKSSEQERLIKDFWREAQILSKLHHPNVLAFYGVVPDGPGGTLATVTEYMINGSLKHALSRRDRALDRRRKLLIATDAACGMEYLHTKNIVHFDLKCDNLLVNLRDPQRPICKVGDFGLSRIKRNTLVTGGVRGTLPWMAPELLDGSSNKVSEKVDVFSFGIALWELLTGEEPYVGMHCGAIIGGIVSNSLRPVIPQRCDPQWKALMEECWAADPAARPTFTEIGQRLRGMSKKLEAKPSRLHTKVSRE